MTHREFIALLGGVSAWPFASAAARPSKKDRGVCVWR